MDDSEYQGYRSLSEVMEVEKIVEVVHSKTGKCYRLEAVRHVHGTAFVHYGVHYYQMTRDSNGVRIWTEYLNFPWISQGTADNALKQALSYVNDRPQLGDG
jgi:hypothetical protein